MKHILITEKEKYSILAFNRGKANAMNAELLKEFREALRASKKNEQSNGLILTGKAHFFSAGLDVIELYNYNEAEIKDFWSDFANMKLDLLEFYKPVVAAISGHSPAGGCIVAISSDYRVMAEGKYRIGLNEVPVGIVIPEHIFDMYAFWIGKKQAYQALLEGKLFSSAEAMEVGLVDELCPLEDVLATAENQMGKYLKMDAMTWQNSKENMRKSMVEKVRKAIPEMVESTCRQWWTAGSRARLKALVDQLTK